MRQLFAILLLLTLALPASSQVWETLHDFETIPDPIFIADDGSIFAVASFHLYNGGSGFAWEEVAPDVFIQDVVSIGDLLYAASLRGVLRSDDDGLTWDVIMPSQTWSVYVDAEYIAAGGGGGQLYVSEDAGSTWSVTNCSTMPLGFDSYVGPVMVDDGVQMWGHLPGGTHTSLSSGAWTYDEQFRPDYFVRLPDGRTLASDGETLLAYSDGSWDDFAELPISFSDRLDVVGSNMALVSTSLHVSGDLGESWTEIDLPVDEFPYDAAIDQQGRVVVGTSCCVRRTIEPIANLVATGKQNEAPETTTALLAPLPNPAPHGARVRFTLGQPSSVRIEILDASGRVVDHIADNQYSFGLHEIWIETSHLASGMYFVRMSAAGRQFTQPVTVVR